MVASAIGKHGTGVVVVACVARQGMGYMICWGCGFIRHAYIFTEYSKF